MKFSVKELINAFIDYTGLLLNIKFIFPDRTRNNDMWNWSRKQLAKYKH